MVKGGRLDGVADPSGWPPITSVTGQVLLREIAVDPIILQLVAHFPVPEPGTNVQNLRPVWPARETTIWPKEHGGVGVLWCYGAMEEWRSCGGVVAELWRFEMERRGVERRP